MIRRVLIPCLLAASACDLFAFEHAGQVVECFSDADCSKGSRCESYVCVPPSVPTPDAGPETADTASEKAPLADSGGAMGPDADATLPSVADAADAHATLPDAADADALPPDTADADATDGDGPQQCDEGLDTQPDNEAAPDGCPASFETDPMNCGRCGRACDPLDCADNDVCAPNACFSGVCGVPQDQGIVNGSSEYWAQPQYLYAFQLQSSGGSATAIGMKMLAISNRPAPNAVLGIYSDVGGAPAALVAKVNDGRPVHVAYNATLLFVLDSPLTLQPHQDYWLAAAFDEGGAIFAASDTQLVKQSLSEAPETPLADGGSTLSSLPARAPSPVMVCDPLMVQPNSLCALSPVLYLVTAQ